MRESFSLMDAGDESSEVELNQVLVSRGGGGLMRVDEGPPGVFFSSSSSSANSSVPIPDPNLNNNNNERAASFVEHENPMLLRPVLCSNLEGRKSPFKRSKSVVSFKDNSTSTGKERRGGKCGINISSDKTVERPSSTDIKAACRRARGEKQEAERKRAKELANMTSARILKKKYERRVKKDTASTLFSRRYFAGVLEVFCMACMGSIIFWGYPLNANMLLPGFAVLELATWAYFSRYSFSRMRVKGSKIFFQYFLIFLLHGMAMYGSLYILDELNATTPGMQPSNLKSGAVTALTGSTKRCWMYNEDLYGSEYANMCPQVRTNMLVSPQANPLGLDIAKDPTLLKNIVRVVDSLKPFLINANAQYATPMWPDIEPQKVAEVCSAAFVDTMCHSITPMCNEECEPMARCTSDCLRGAQWCPALEVAETTFKDYREVIDAFVLMEDVPTNVVDIFLSSFANYTKTPCMESTSTTWAKPGDVMCSKQGKPYKPRMHHEVSAPSGSNTGENFCVCPDGDAFHVDGDTAGCSDDVCIGGVSSRLNQTGCFPIYFDSGRHHAFEEYCTRATNEQSCRDLSTCRWEPGCSAQAPSAPSTPSRSVECSDSTSPKSDPVSKESTAKCTGIDSRDRPVNGAYFVELASSHIETAQWIELGNAFVCMLLAVYVSNRAKPLHVSTGSRFREDIWDHTLLGVWGSAALMLLYALLVYMVWLSVRLNNVFMQGRIKSCDWLRRFVALQGADVLSKFHDLPPISGMSEDNELCQSFNYVSVLGRALKEFTMIYFCIFVVAYRALGRSWPWQWVFKAYGIKSARAKLKTRSESGKSSSSHRSGSKFESPNNGVRKARAASTATNISRISRLRNIKPSKMLKKLVKLRKWYMKTWSYKRGKYFVYKQFGSELIEITLQALVLFTQSQNFGATQLLLFSAVLSMNMIVSPLLLIQSNPLYSRDFCLVFDACIDMFYVAFNGIVMADKFEAGEEVTASFLGREDTASIVTPLNVLSVAYPAIRTTMGLSRVMINLGRGKARSQKEVIEADRLLGRTDPGAIKTRTKKADSLYSIGSSASSLHPSSLIEGMTWGLAIWRLVVGTAFGFVVASGFTLFLFVFLRIKSQELKCSTELFPSFDARVGTCVWMGSHPKHYFPDSLLGETSCSTELVRSLDAKGCGLNKLPSDIYAVYPNLASLDVSNNEMLRDIWLEDQDSNNSSFYALSNLTRLDITNTAIDNVPNFLGCMLQPDTPTSSLLIPASTPNTDHQGKLASVIMGSRVSGRITSVNFSHLEARCTMQMLPISSFLKSLKNLQSLDVSFNQLRDVSLGSAKKGPYWPSLKRFNASHNRIASVTAPSEALGNEIDVTIDFSHNQLRNVPSALANWQGFRASERTLHVGYNDLITNITWVSQELEKLPEGIDTLKNLRHVDLSVNQNLPVFPSELRSLSSLVTLRLGSFALAIKAERFKIPKNFFANMKDLRVLSLASAHLMGSVPATFATSLTNLEKLSMVRNAITSLPTEMGLMSNLNTLLLHDSQKVLQLPSEIGLLKNLRNFAIGVGGTCPSGMQNLPDSFSNLEFTSLWVPGNCPNRDVVFRPVLERCNRSAVCCYGINVLDGPTEACPDIEPKATV